MVLRSRGLGGKQCAGNGVGASFVGVFRGPSRTSCVSCGPHVLVFRPPLATCPRRSVRVAATLTLLEEASAMSLPAAAAPKARSKAAAKAARKASPAESLKGPPVQKAVSKKAREGSNQK